MGAADAVDQLLDGLPVRHGQPHDDRDTTILQAATDLGIEILDVEFKRINYVAEVQRKVYERMISERQRIADRFRSEGQGEAFRIRGEKHSWTPDTVADLQHAVRGNLPDKYRAFAEAINRQAEQKMITERQQVDIKQYEDQVEADVKGTPFDPTAKKSVQISA